MNTLSPAPVRPAPVRYVEARRQVRFDWHAFLRQRSTSPPEWAAATALAANWVTCACGDQCAVLPRDIAGVPLDDQLFDLGLVFSEQIADRDRPGARRTLGAIERRAARLLELYHGR